MKRGYKQRRLMIFTIIVKSITFDRVDVRSNASFYMVWRLHIGCLYSGNVNKKYVMAVVALYFLL